MQPSPLQLDELRFLHVHISPRLEPDVREQDLHFERYEFQKTKFNSTIEHIFAEEDDSSPVTSFLVTLKLELPDVGENPPPYVIDIKCVGYFGISKAAFPDATKRYDVGVVNATSMLYGAIREMISTITGRSWFGQIFLPSVNFQSDAPSNGKHKMVKLPDAKSKSKSNPRSKKIKAT